MRNVLKHWDILLLCGIVVAVLGAVFILDKKLGAREDAATEDLLSPDSIVYQGDNSGTVSTPQTDQPTETRTIPTVLENELPRANRAQLPMPKPLERGVVHLGQGAALGGKRPFPDDNAWNQTIDDLPVDPFSDIMIRTIGIDKNLHPDFGAEYWDGSPNGIPYIVVSGDQKPVPIVYTAYGDESDPGPFPIPPNAPIEGHPRDEGCDRHCLVIDRDNWRVYELFRAFNIADGRLWRAECGATFDLAKHPDRPEGWTSADAAGLPIFPGLVRYDETVELGEIRHALRFTTQRTRRAFVPPASHWASRSHEQFLPPMGMRVRLRSDFDIAPFPPEAQVILTCLKKYGMILADNGGDWFISGAPDPRWNDEAIRTLKQVKGYNFEVVLMEGLVEDK
ncbi:MAG: hypothetical protein KDA80_07800 [Planctomycetaceae bacterium]|nr:hypothetical protein [Planctomycetaceae bacterium]